MKDVRGIHAVVREGEMIAKVIEQMDAQKTLQLWQEVLRREMRGNINRWLNLRC